MGCEPGFSVLIVDDEGTNLYVLNQILKNEYEVHAAKSGKAAMKIVGACKPDIILLDVVMPEKNGFEVFTDLKQNEDTKDIPVIFITGLDNKDDEQQAMSLGAAGYITKPFNSADVRKCISAQLKEKL